MPSPTPLPSPCASPRLTRNETVLPLAKIGQVLNRPHYIEEAKRQFLIHIKYLFDTKTGLFHHGWTFLEGGHNFASAAWGRGNRYVQGPSSQPFRRCPYVTPR